MANEIDHERTAKLWLELAVIYDDLGESERASEARKRSSWHAQQPTKKKENAQ